MSKSFGSFSHRVIKYAEKKVQKGFDYLDSRTGAANTDPNNLTNAHQNQAPVQPTASAQNAYPQSGNFNTGPPPPPPPPPLHSSTNPAATPSQPYPSSNQPQPTSPNNSAPVSNQPPSTSFSTPYHTIPPAPLPSTCQPPAQNPITPHPAQPPQQYHAQNIATSFSPQLPSNYQHPPNASVSINAQQTSSHTRPQNLATQSTAPQQPNYPSAQPLQYSHADNAPISYIPTQPLPNHHAQPASSSPGPLLNSSGPIITEELLLHMQTRRHSACECLGRNAVIEARKGLSRVLTTTKADIDFFAYQLKTSQDEVFERNWNTLDDNLPCFALSYVQYQAIGHFKFSDHQWRNFHAVVEALAHVRITHFRVWLDQCLWLRDASTSTWAHTGILPYVLWPVIALGSKRPGEGRTTDSLERMWPFVEQTAGLWGMGVIIASEYRPDNDNAGTRELLSYNVRFRTEPKQNLMIILLNVFHGAIDDLKTGWVNDVKELKEIAVANIMYDTQDKVVIGPDWKERIAAIAPLEHQRALKKIEMPIDLAKFDMLTYMYNRPPGGRNIYLDRSRTLQCRGWDGVTEWFSGNEGPTKPTDDDLRRIYNDVDKYKIVTDNGEYQLLGRRSTTEALWLLVAIQGRSSHFSSGRVMWTKVLTGLTTCKLCKMLKKNIALSLQKVLREQLKNEKLRVVSANPVDSDIRWV